MTERLTFFATLGSTVAGARPEEMDPLHLAVAAVGADDMAGIRTEIDGAVTDSRQHNVEFRIVDLGGLIGARPEVLEIAFSKTTENYIPPAGRILMPMQAITQKEANP